MRTKEFILFSALLALMASGCMRFSQHDYDLQQNAYQKERQQQEQKDRDMLQMRW